jgi:polyisoprenoid-binding protein YceI
MRAKCRSGISFVQPLVAACLAASLLGVVPAPAQQTIDSAKSVMSIHVSKSGVLSAFGHDHDISAPIARGEVDTKARRVELRVHSEALRVRDKDTSEKDRAEIQKNMLGPEVLDAARYPEIAFRSTAAEPAAAGAWTVRGDLTLHGQTRPIAVEVQEKNGHYVGAARVKQSDFGIKPVKVAGGTVRVKDEVRVEFDIQLAR